MAAPLDDLMARVAAQGQRLPGMYGRVDFGTLPERYTESADVRSTLEARQPGAGARSCWPSPRPWRASVPTRCWATPWPMPMPR